MTNIRSQPTNPSTSSSKGGRSRSRFGEGAASKNGIGGRFRRRAARRTTRFRSTSSTFVWAQTRRDNSGSRCNARVRQRERDIGSSVDFERLQSAWRLADGSRYAAQMRAVEGNWQQPSGFHDTLIIYSRDWDDHLKSVEEEARGEAVKKSGL